MNTITSAELAGHPHSARTARALVSQALGPDHPSAADAALAVSELVSNAIAHTRSGQPGGTLTVAIEASAQPPSVCIHVRDAGSPGVPEPTAAHPDDEHGRGLAIIAALAADWGTQTSEHGRDTWCRITQADNSAQASAAIAPGPSRMTEHILPGQHSTLADDIHVGRQARARSVAAQPTRLAELEAGQ